MEEIDVLRALVKISEAGKPVIARSGFKSASYNTKGDFTNISLRVPGNHVSAFVAAMRGDKMPEFMTMVITDREALDKALVELGVDLG